MAGPQTGSPSGRAFPGVDAKTSTFPAPDVNDWLRFVSAQPLGDSLVRWCCRRLGRVGQLPERRRHSFAQGQQPRPYLDSQAGPGDALLANQDSPHRRDRNAIPARYGASRRVRAQGREFCLPASQVPMAGRRRPPRMAPKPRRSRSMIMAVRCLVAFRACCRSPTSRCAVMGDCDGTCVRCLSGASAAKPRVGFRLTIQNGCRGGAAQ